MRERGRSTRCWRVKLELYQFRISNRAATCLPHSQTQPQLKYRVVRDPTLTRILLPVLLGRGKRKILLLSLSSTCMDSLGHFPKRFFHPISPLNNPTPAKSHTWTTPAHNMIPVHLTSTEFQWAKPTTRTSHNTNSTCTILILSCTTTEAWGWTRADQRQFCGR